MSRSNPNEGSQNPSVRWFEWNGENGVVRYYDKTAKKNVDLGADLMFILLDQLATVRGWHEPSQSGIYSNEVRDTRQDALVVKAFKGGILAEGVYRDIKDRVNTLGGQFNANCYIAFKNGGDGFAIGSIRFKGAALGTWMEFTKAQRAELYKQAVKITGYTEGKKGRITYRMPTFKLVPVSDATNNVATALDLELQAFLDGYLKRTKRDQVESQAPLPEDDAPPQDDREYPPGAHIAEDDIPW